MLSLNTVTIDYWITTDFIKPFMLNGISIQWSSGLTCIDLVVNTDNQCSQLNRFGWKTITIASGLCNTGKKDLQFIGSSCLESITVDTDSLKSLTSLTLSSIF